MAWKTVVLRWSLVPAVACALACDGNGDLLLPDTGSPDGTSEEDTDTPGLPPAPPLRNAVDLEDGVLAYEALLLPGHMPLGPTSEACSECHSISQGQIEAWRQMTLDAEAGCFSDPITSEADALEIVDCVRMKPDVEGSPFDTSRLGLYSAAAHLDYFDYVFDVSFGDDSDEQDDFLRRVSMPAASRSAWTQGEFDVVAEWFARGTPFISDFLPEDVGAGACEPSISAEVGDHIDRMALEGWRAVNESDNLLMFGCAGVTRPIDCLGDYDRSLTWAHLPRSTVRMLRTNDFSSSFWTRSSADGRFVGLGGGRPGVSSTVIDLATDQEIAIGGLYDPAFFPDNSAFMWQGTVASGTSICSQDLLTSGVTSVSFYEPECSGSSQVGLYQHVGQALDGGDYWTVNGRFVSDNGGQDTTIGNPSAFFGPGDSITLTPMVATGGDYVPGEVSDIFIPYEGDTVISRSSELLVSRIAGADSIQDGMALRLLEATPTETGYDVEVPIIATYCVNGGKPDISYDERWMVLHTYVSNTDVDAQELGFIDRNDPGFAPYIAEGAANLFLVDLRTSLSRRITDVSPGEYALFPHFRSDGWIYFVVRNRTNTEWVAASNAALMLEN
jgi:hypothetical protein